MLGLRWPEIDMDKKIWTVPADRMKAGREHRVPLSARAPCLSFKLLAKARQKANSPLPDSRLNKPLSGMAMEMMLRRMKIDDATVHGFRSSFRDWAGNVSELPARG